jgi:hypothetical protein
MIPRFATRLIDQVTIRRPRPVPRRRLRARPDLDPMEPRLLLARVVHGDPSGGRGPDPAIVSHVPPRGNNGGDLINAINEAYNDMKALAPLFDLQNAAHTQTVDVGSFDAATGEFLGLTTERLPIANWPTRPPSPGLGDPPDDGPGNPLGARGTGGLANGHPLFSNDVDGLSRSVTPSVNVDAAFVKVRFEVVNNDQIPVSLFVNGTPVTVRPGQHSVTVDAGFAKRVHWTIRARDKSYSDSLIIDRPHVIGAGAFTVPVLPIAVVYEPAQEPGVRATATYSNTQWMGTTVDMSFTRENSEIDADFDSLGPFANDLKDVASGLKDLVGSGSSLGPYSGAFQVAYGALHALSDLFDSTHNSLGSGQAVTQDHKLDTSKFYTDTISTSEHAGPGHGDVIVFLRDARIAWVYDKGDLRLVYLGSTGRSTAVTVDGLKNDLTLLGSGQDPSRTNTKLDAGTIRSLLALDPFVAYGPQAPLSGPRFVRNPTPPGIEGNTPRSEAFGHSISQTDTVASTDFLTSITETDPGFLSFFGPKSGQQKQAVMSTIRHGSSTSGRSGQDVTELFSLDVGPKGYYDYDIYYDRVFGTYVYVAPPGAPTGPRSGVLDVQRSKGPAEPTGPGSGVLSVQWAKGLAEPTGPRSRAPSVHRTEAKAPAEVAAPLVHGSSKGPSIKLLDSPAPQKPALRPVMLAVPRRSGWVAQKVSSR